jgi:hypothetical protein
VQKQHFQDTILRRVEDMQGSALCAITGVAVVAQGTVGDSKSRITPPATRRSPSVDLSS